MKEEALDHTLWGALVAKCCGPVVRQTTELMDDVSIGFLNPYPTNVENRVSS